MLAVGSAVFSSFDISAKKQLLSFSTLGCPDWSFEKILDFAVANGYKGIEIRGIQRELDLTKAAPFSNANNIRYTKKLVKDKGLSIINLGASASLHHSDTATRQKHIDEGKRFIDLASEISCPYVRIFPNNFPKEQEKNATMDLISKGLLELAGHANGSKVMVLLETHGDVIYVNDLVKIMESSEHKHTGLVWDIVNMWSVTKEDPAVVYPQLKKYIRHTHIKDLKTVDGKHVYTLIGEGDTPVLKAVDLLRKDGYKGYYSFEWEKLWHPEIAEPEIAFSHYAKKMREHFSKT